MAAMISGSITDVPLLSIVRPQCSLNGRSKPIKTHPLDLNMQFQPFNAQRCQVTLTASHPIGLAAHLKPIHKRRTSLRSSTICFSALNARCGAAEGQTQTITRQTPTITQAPIHNSPELDDGGTGFPPRDDGDGGGGGGGGGGNWSGGFAFFGFLAFMGFLKDKEGDDDNRRR